MNKNRFCPQIYSADVKKVSPFLLPNVLFRHFSESNKPYFFYSTVPQICMNIKSLWYCNYEFCLENAELCALVSCDWSRHSVQWTFSAAFHSHGGKESDNKWFVNVSSVVRIKNHSQVCVHSPCRSLSSNTCWLKQVTEMWLGILWTQDFYFKEKKMR